MDKYIVLYTNHCWTVGDNPFGFRCHAGNGDHAEEQCIETEPNADVVWVVQTDDYEAALRDYYNNWEL